MPGVQVERGAGDEDVQAQAQQAHRLAFLDTCPSSENADARGVDDRDCRRCPPRAAVSSGPMKAAVSSSRPMPTWRNGL
jgi:hypothetical protein